MDGPNEKRNVDDRGKSSEACQHSYYYDDAHGYEDFDPEDNEEDEEPDEQN
jgi:hypothetical protein